MSNLPFVSVIIPIYNAEKFLPDLFRTLSSQTYPTDKFEVLLIDNSSCDSSEKLINQYIQSSPNTKYLVQKEIQGSYATRNLGIETSTADILVFTDSDCQPVPQWLEEGVNCLMQPNVDVVGGNVDFIYSEKATGAEILDSISNMQIQENIEKRGVAKTANLFVKRFVFEKIGLFDGTLKSGGDVIWTKKATDAGFNLVFCKNATVFHPTRSWKELYKKQVRVGGGRINVLRTQDNFVKALIKEVAWSCKPPSISVVERRLKEKGKEQFLSKRWNIWLAEYFAKLATLDGMFFSIFNTKQ